MHPTDHHELRRGLTILHLALCLGCAAFMGVTAYLWSTGVVPIIEGAELPLLSNVALVFAVVAPLLAVLLFRKRIRAIPPDNSPMALVMQVRGACVLHWALIEGALLLNLVVFMLHAASLHWGVAAGLLGLLVLRAPTERRIQRWTMGTP